MLGGAWRDWWDSVAFPEGIFARPSDEEVQHNYRRRAIVFGSAAVVGAFGLYRWYRKRR